MSDLQDAVEEVWPGDQSLETLALLDQLEKRDLAVVPRGHVRFRRRRWWPFR